MREALEIAERIGDGRARAYARAGLLHCRTRLGLDSFEAAEAAKAELMRDAQEFGDNFVRNAAYFAATWDYFYRGLVNEARAMAIRLIASSKESADPRAIGFANWMLGWIQIVCGAPDAAIGYAEECAEVATTPFDRLQGEIIRAVALVLSGHAAEGLEKMDRLNREFERLGALYSVLGAPRGAALVALGRITEGISVIERSIARARRGRRSDDGRLRPRAARRNPNRDRRRRTQGAVCASRQEPSDADRREARRRAPRA